MRRTSRCRATSHRLADNPLRAHGRLGAACGVEYAAQAMAVHGAIMAHTSGTKARAGLLMSVRSLVLAVTRLDDLATDLIAGAARLAGDEGSTLYEFTVSSGRPGASQRPRQHRVWYGVSMSETVKRALVTGGSGGIGAAICRRLAREDTVYVHARQGVNAAEKVSRGNRCRRRQRRGTDFDVTEMDSTRKALETALASGPIQILVNNAGVIDDAVLPGMRAEQWHRVIDVSVMASSM